MLHYEMNCIEDVANALAASAKGHAVSYNANGKYAPHFNKLWDEQQRFAVRRKAETR